MLKRMLFSTRTMGTLLLVFAVSMAVATFVENDYGTPVAKELIYNSWWFETVMVWLIINFLGNIGRYKLYRREKWPLLVFHLAFLFILIGAGITRYISYEGSMHIREGSREERFVSEATFFKIQISDGNNVQNYQDKKASFISGNVPLFFRMLKPGFSASYNFQNDKVKVELLDFIARAQDSILPQQNGAKVLHLVTTDDGQRQNIYIPSGSVKQVQGVEVGYNKATNEGIEITEDAKGDLQIKSPFAARYMVMATQQADTIKAVNVTEPMRLRALYTFNMGLAFVVPEFPQRGTIVHYEGDKKKDAFAPDLVVLGLKSNKAADTIAFYGGRGLTGYQANTRLGNLKITLGYGSRYYYTPFFMYLKKFQLDKYPGSNSPSSYASDVVVMDGGAEMEHRIFMNHVLDYRGFRFFQTSYDPDEKGTILSVNHDVSGTIITYVGYALLFLGMFVTLFWKGTRFSILNQQLKSMAAKKVVTVLAVLLSVLSVAHAQAPAPAAPAQANAAEQQVDGKSFAAKINIDKKHAEAFGYLPVQNIDGRIEPANTLGLEILRKLNMHDDYHNLDANQFLLAITSQPFEWLYAPIIKINKRGGEELLKLTKANEEGLTCIMNLLKLDAAGDAHFLLEEEYHRSFAKKMAEQDLYDKEVIEINDKMQVVQALLNGMYLRVIPRPFDTNNTWDAWSFMQAPKNQGEKLVQAYCKAVLDARTSGNWQQADQLLKQIKDLQKIQAANIMPSDAKINWEVRFNAWNLFFKLMIFYTLAGTLLLLLSLAGLFKKSALITWGTRITIATLVVAALLQAFGLGVRWYVSGHEPWSNGYEAVMFISMIGLISGLALYKNRNSFIPAAGALIAVCLMGFAHGGAQMNPQITPLVPVLKSYWLMIHVAIITASYGFFGLSAVLGMMVLLLHIVNNKKNRHVIGESMRELTIVNEMSLTIGLFLLTVGTFLGGMWANESWGRYWSWDPKETWAFISVIVYAFVLHIRLIPGLGSKFLFNALALVCFSTVIMTYFGVNYYLSGLHSYAKGDPVPIPGWVYITIALVGAVIVTAYYRHRQLENSIEKKVVAPGK